MSSSKKFAIVDFETTGLSPDNGARITEVAVVIVEDGTVVDHFQSLAKTGVWISSEIERLTGINNDMVSNAPDAKRVMQNVATFVGSAVPVAHNASFDKKFWNAEMVRAEQPIRDDFICTLLLSRHLYPKARDHKLGTLADFHSLQRDGNAHRALSDAKLTAQLFLKICRDAKAQNNLTAVEHSSVRSLLNILSGAGSRTIQDKGRHAQNTSVLNTGFMRPLKPSTELAAIVGSNPLPRTEVVSALWAYIKAHGLQDTTNRRMINCDQKLAALLGKRQVSMFELAGLIGKHVS